MRASHDRIGLRFAPGLATALTCAASAHATPESYCDLAVEAVAVSPTTTAGRYAVDVDVSFTAEQLLLSQPLVVRVYVNGAPRDESLLDVVGALSEACCSSNSQCDDISGWNKRCESSCASGSGGPRACVYRRRASFVVDGVAPLAWVSATVDPDGLHDESCAPGASNNSAGAAAPLLSFGNLSLESLELTSSPLSGEFIVAIGVRLVPGGGTLSVAPLVRLASSGGAVFELALDSGIGLGGDCCDNDAQCPPLQNFTVKCEGQCNGGIGGLHQCVYRRKAPTNSQVLVPGELLTATIDPDGLYVETEPIGAGNNSVTALVPESIASYCVGKLNSAGCVSELTHVGSPSASSPVPFVIAALDVLPGRNGLLFYGAQRASAPFLGGVLCVAQPVRRTAVQTSSGVPGVLDCSGTFAFDFNARIQSGLDPLLSVGAFAAAQQWWRDPADPAGFGTSLSNALWFQIGL